MVDRQPTPGVHEHFACDESGQGAGFCTSDRDYANAFYELATLMNIPARSESPAHVWRTEMLPRLRAALATPAPVSHLMGTVPCPCTLIEQDEDCPVGYPSMICGICEGTGNTTPDQVTALACEMIKIASDIGEPEDPFAAWESIDLIKSQHGRLRDALKPFAFAMEHAPKIDKRPHDFVITDEFRKAAEVYALSAEGPQQ